MSIEERIIAQKRLGGDEKQAGPAYEDRRVGRFAEYDAFVEYEPLGVITWAGGSGFPTGPGLTSPGQFNVDIASIWDVPGWETEEHPKYTFNGRFFAPVDAGLYTISASFNAFSASPSEVVRSSLSIVDAAGEDQGFSTAAPPGASSNTGVTMTVYAAADRPFRLNGQIWKANGGADLVFGGVGAALSAYVRRIG